MSLIFHVAPMSSATPVAAALNELEVPHERIVYDLSQGDHKKPAFLALNPNAKVPTLVVDGTPMFEALAIMQWLGDRYGVAKGLWPAADSPQRLAALSWTTWAYVTCGATFQVLNFASSPNVPVELHHPKLATFAAGQFQEHLAVLNGKLTSQPYLLGAEYSLADLVVAGMVGYAAMCGVSLTDHPKVAEWLERCQSRPAVQKEWGAGPA